MQVTELFWFGDAGRFGHQVNALRGFRERNHVADDRISEKIPSFHRDFASEDGFNLPEQHTDLWN